jgi:hypothetical protein
MGPTAADGLEVEALLTDHYLASLLAARDRRALDVPADLRVHPDLRQVARRLDAELGRVHPSFHFEERLATQLAARAATMTQDLRAGSPSAERRLRLIPDDGVAPDSALGPPQARQPAPPARPWEPRFRHALGALLMSAVIDRVKAEDDIQLLMPDPLTRSRHDTPRPLLIGGAITSAAVSVAGAYVAWRRGRPVATPMSRAVRAANLSRAPRGRSFLVHVPRWSGHRLGTR